MPRKPPSHFGSGDSRTADKFVVRLPEGWRDAVSDKARERKIAMNTVCLQALEKELFGTSSSWTPVPSMPVFYEDQPAIIEDVLIRSGMFFAEIKGEDEKIQVVPCTSLTPFQLTALDKS